MLMSLCSSIFLLVESFIFGTVTDHIAGDLCYVVMWVTVLGFAHLFVFGFEVT